MFYWAAILLVVIISYNILDYLVRLPWVPGLHKKCVVITGCDSGFGNALAKSLYRRGVFVFAGCYTENGAKSLTEETGERLKTFRLDVSKTESIEECFQFVKENLPEGTVLWGLVNNAGIGGFWGPYEFVSRQDAMEVLQVNCLGMMEMVRVFLPLLKASRGRIVNVSSVVGKMPFSLAGAYTVSKFALFGFSEALRLEKAIWGIKVSTICPAGFKTPILDIRLMEERIKETLEKLSPNMKTIANQEYGQDYFQKVTKFYRDSFDSTVFSDISPVISAYEHALFSCRPRNIYYPGTGTATLVKLQEFFPALTEPLQTLSLRAATPKALQN